MPSSSPQLDSRHLMMRPMTYLVILHSSLSDVGAGVVQTPRCARVTAETSWGCTDRARPYSVPAFPIWSVTSRALIFSLSIRLRLFSLFFSSHRIHPQVDSSYLIKPRSHNLRTFFAHNTPGSFRTSATCFSRGKLGAPAGIPSLREPHGGFFFFKSTAFNR